MSPSSASPDPACGAKRRGRTRFLTTRVVPYPWPELPLPWKEAEGVKVAWRAGAAVESLKSGMAVVVWSRATPDGRGCWVNFSLSLRHAAPRGRSARAGSQERRPGGLTRAAGRGKGRPPAMTPRTADWQWIPAYQLVRPRPSHPSLADPRATVLLRVDPHLRTSGSGDGRMDVSPCAADSGSVQPRGCRGGDGASLADDG